MFLRGWGGGLIPQCKLCDCTINAEIDGVEEGSQETL